MNKIRLRYEKVGKAKYISHLDLSATMQRAMIRAGIALKYSEGFNPHPYMSVALPLSVGTQSECELMDVSLIDASSIDTLPSLISACLPEGLEVKDAYLPARKFSDLAWVEITGLMYYDGGIPLNAVQRLKERFSEKSIEVSKKTKRGMTTLDIAQFIRDLDFSGGDAITIKAKLSAQNPTLNPGNIMDALEGQYEELAPDYAFFKRLEVFDSNLAVFR